MMPIILTKNLDKDPFYSLTWIGPCSYRYHFTDYGIYYGIVYDVLYARWGNVLKDDFIPFKSILAIDTNKEDNTFNAYYKHNKISPIVLSHFLGKLIDSDCYTILFRNLFSGKYTNDPIYKYMCNYKNTYATIKIEKKPLKRRTM